MLCCKNDLGEFAHNSDIDTGIATDQTGTHKLLIIGSGFSKFTSYQFYESGSNVIIPQGLLIEDCVYTLNITKPDGTVISQDDCVNFSFKTFVNKVECNDLQYL